MRTYLYSCLWVKILSHSGNVQVICPLESENVDVGEVLDSGESCDTCDSFEGVLVGVKEVEENSLYRCESSTSENVMEDKVTILKLSFASAHVS